MFPVSDIWEDASKVLGVCSDTVKYRRITDAVELLANKGDFDPMIGFVDLCVDCQLVALPREVETVLGVNLAGRPAVPRDQLFTFHLNGPGDTDARLSWEWTDNREAFTYRELECPSKLIGFAQRKEDENAELWVEGVDVDGNVIRTLKDGKYVNGSKIPVFVDQQALPEDAPTYAGITGIRKALTEGAIRLGTVDNDDQSGTLLGVFQWDEVVPRYRRIKISQPCEWVRIAFRRRTFQLRSQDDLIPLHNSMSVVLMLKAIKKYMDPEPEAIALAEGLEATAVRWLREEQNTRSAPTVHPIQVHEAGLQDPLDAFVE